MKVNELKEAVNSIYMDEEMQKEVVENVKAKTGRKHRNSRRYQWRKTAAAAVIAVAVLGAAAFPVKAFVNSLIRERMEKMPEEEVTVIAENVENQTAEADSYSRDYTTGEKERYQELYRQYKNGTFPDGEIPQAASGEEAGQYEFCYLTDAARFCLPRRELTDEELLEIIDFILKREYSFTKNYEEEHTKEIAEREEKQKEEIAQKVESGGITEQQAIETAADLLSDIFGITGENMEFNHYYDGGEEVLAPDGNQVLRPEVESYYCVNWSDIITHQYYYFYISAEDGRMISVSHSSGELVDAKGVTIEEAESKIPVLTKQAEAFMKEQIKETCQKEYVYYLAYEDGTTNIFARFIFEKEDGSAYEVAYLWDGTFTDFEETDLSNYENEKIIVDSVDEEEIKAKTIFRQISE